jgi:hypothetical protein
MKTAEPAAETLAPPTEVPVEVHSTVIPQIVNRIKCEKILRDLRCPTQVFRTMQAQIQHQSTEGCKANVLEIGTRILKEYFYKATREMQENPSLADEEYKGEGIGDDESIVKIFRFFDHKRIV